MLFKDKVAVITGGPGGLGKAIATTFLREGASVVLTDVSADALTAGSAELSRFGPVLTSAGDVSSADDVADAAALAVKHFGMLDIWVNNAGFTRDATMRRMSEADFDDVLRVHLKGTWLGTREAAAKEVGFANVRVNAVAPGIVKTPMTEALSEKVKTAKLAEVPMGRYGEPAEVAGAVLFLSSYMPGTVLEVTGGRHI